MVSTEERRRRIPEVITELLPEYAVDNRATASEFPEDASMERVEEPQ
jgi:hypothetical protein